MFNSYVKLPEGNLFNLAIDIENSFIVDFPIKNGDFP